MLLFVVAGALMFYLPVIEQPNGAPRNFCAFPVRLLRRGRALAVMCYIARR